MLATHIIFGAYGFWLPNDPRGSWSTFVDSWELLRYGRATKTVASRSVAGRPHDREMRLAAKAALKRPPVKFTGAKALVVSRGIASYADRSGIEIWACAILPDRVHLVVGPSAVAAKQLVIQLKGEATRRLIAEGVHPFGDLRTKDGRTPKWFCAGPMGGVSRFG